MLFVIAVDLQWHIVSCCCRESDDYILFSVTSLDSHVICRWRFLGQGSSIVTSLPRDHCPRRRTTSGRWFGTSVHRWLWCWRRMWSAAEWSVTNTGLTSVKRRSLNTLLWTASQRHLVTTARTFSATLPCSMMMLVEIHDILLHLNDTSLLSSLYISNSDSYAIMLVAI